MSEVTRILDEMDAGGAQAAERLLPLVYDELRKLAAQRLVQEKPGHTLQATALVHEAYLRLVANPGRQPGGDDNHPRPEGRSSPEFANRAHFFAAAAEAMRRILVERARRKRRLKRGGDRNRVDLDDLEITVEGPTDDIEALDEALTRLAAKHSEKAELVKLRYFAGLTVDQAAQVLGISSSTADRYWTYARAWLLREITPDGAD
jgi:RNA polymerase sigma factor (TIGR02999 family)